MNGQQKLPIIVFRNNLARYLVILADVVLSQQNIFEFRKNFVLYLHDILCCNVILLRNVLSLFFVEDTINKHMLVNCRQALVFIELLHKVLADVSHLK